MSSFALRILAITAMLCDHTAVILLPPGSDIYLLMRGFGRIAFPIFCFLIAEGYLHTRSASRYLGRLALFALISEMPFDIAVHGRLFSRGSNVFWTLSLGLCLLIIMGSIIPELLKRLDIPGKYRESRLLCAAISSPLIYAACLASDAFFADYGAGGVLFIVFIYVFRQQPFFLALSLILTNTLFYCSSISFSAPQLGSLLFNLDISVYHGIQIYAPFALIPLAFYNGQPGERRFKWLFYVFYPAHFLLLWLLNIII